jgi:methionyl-tRNA formyltransferase
MRILFAGSPAIAVPSLVMLASHTGTHFTVVGILTNPDSLRGRHGTPVPTDIGAAAANILPDCPQLKPEKLDSSARSAVAELQPDLLISFAYGRIFGPRFLALFPYGGINVHPSLLPRYRGASPVAAAILNREPETGISIQRIALEMDTGDLLIQERFPLTGRETTALLSDSLADKAAPLLLDAVTALSTGTVEGVPQSLTGVSYCRLWSKEDGLIDWSKSAVELDAQIRAFTPWPLSFTNHDGRCLYLLEAEPTTAAPSDAKPGTVLGSDRSAGLLIQTGDGVLGVRRLQYQAKKALLWYDFLNGAPELIGAQL